MIFCTIGTQAPFDRFLQIVDDIAASFCDEEIVVQAFHDKYEPKNVKTVQLLPPDEFNHIFAEARLIVSHAGMGTIISALTMDKPIVVFPRIAALGEHRNEHQLATAKKMNELGYVYVANDEDELRELVTKKELQPLHKLGQFASKELIEDIQNVIDIT